MTSRSPRTGGRKSINLTDAATIAQMAALGSAETQEAVRVVTRVRPFNNREISIHDKSVEGKPAWEQYGIRSVVEFSGNNVTVLDPEKDWIERNRFAFDGALWSIPDAIQPSRNPYAGQETLFEEFGKPMLEQAWKGYNTCFLAYGQTGSGKTYSMMGQPVDTPTEKADPGLIPRLCQELFNQIEHAKDFAEEKKGTSRTFKVSVQYYEIYNEAIKDLLWSLSDLPPAVQAKVNPENLKIRGNQQSGIYVEYLTAVVVTDWMQMLELIDMGNQSRTTASTTMNERSSRSHAVFKVTLTQTTTSVPKRQFDKPVVHSRDSQINLVDLAGSERNKKTGAVGDRLKEAGNINKSLTTLKLVIDGLVEQSRSKKSNVFIPYRDSTLTYMLMDSLGGNSKTFMLITVSPHADNIEETTQSLQYGAKARQIINTVRVNENRGARYILDMEEALNQMREEALVKAQTSTNPEDLIRLQAQIKEHENTIAAVRAETEMQRRNIEELMEAKQSVISTRNKNVMADLEKLGQAATKKSQAAEMEHTLRREVSDLSKTIVTIRNKQDLTHALMETITESIDKLKDQSTSHRYAIAQIQRQHADASTRLWDLRKSDETSHYACKKAAKDRLDFILRTRLAMARETLSYLRKRKEREQIASDELQQLQEVVTKQRLETDEQQSADLNEQEAEESALRLELKKLESDLESAIAERERQLRLVTDKYAKLEEDNSSAIRMKESHCSNTKTMWSKRRDNMVREIENQYRDVLSKSKERHEKEQLESERTLKRIQAENSRTYKAHEETWEARVETARIKNGNDIGDAKTRWESLLDDRRRQMQALRHKLREVEEKEADQAAFSKKVAAVLYHVKKPSSSPSAVKLFELLELYNGQYEEERPNLRHLNTLLTKDVNPNRCADPPALGLDDGVTSAPRPSYPALSHGHVDPNREPSPANPDNSSARRFSFGKAISSSPNRPASLRRRTPSFARRQKSPAPSNVGDSSIFGEEVTVTTIQADGECAEAPTRVPTPTRSQMYSPQTGSGPSAHVQRRSGTPSRSALFFSARLRSKSPITTHR